MNRIEKITRLVYSAISNHGGNWVEVSKKYARQIDEYYCQLFPQLLERKRARSRVKLPQVVGRGGEANDEPLDDKGLREKIAHLPVTMPTGLPKQFVGTDLADQILALLPDIEEARRQVGRDITKIIAEIGIYSDLTYHLGKYLEALKGGE